MSELTQKDFRFPVNSENARKIRGVIDRVFHSQALAGNETEETMSIHRGTARSVFVVLNTAMAAGESLTLDIEVNGASILPAPFVIDENVGAKQQVAVPVNAAAIAPGDIIGIIRSGYVAGGGAAPANAVGVEWA